MTEDNSISLEDMMAGAPDGMPEIDMAVAKQAKQAHELSDEELLAEIEKGKAQEQNKIGLIRYAMSQNETLEANLHENTKIWQLFEEIGGLIDQVMIKLTENWSQYYRFLHPLNIIKDLRYRNGDFRSLRALDSIEELINKTKTSEEYTAILNNSSPTMEIKAITEGNKMVHAKLEVLTQLFLQFFDEKAAEDLGLEFEAAPEVDVSVEFTELSEELFLEVIGQANTESENLMWIIHPNAWNRFAEMNGIEESKYMTYDVVTHYDQPENVLTLRSQMVEN